jgi:hypothetical protein
MTYPYILSDKSLSIMIDSKNYIIEKSHANFFKILDAIKIGNWNNIKNLVDIPKMINTFSNGQVNIVDGQVFYNEQVIHNSLTRRILSLLNENFDITPFINFMNNLMQNPSRSAIKELYDFLESCTLPITEDGYFLAYKKVNTNLKDFYTGKFDHSVGTILEMERNGVDDNRARTCSNGFHFCSFSYLAHYASNTNYKVIILKINPKDVVSIPEDYNFAKGRACKYEVVGEHDGGIMKEAFDKSCYSIPSSDVKDMNKKIINTPLRDSKGRFIKKT